MWTIARLKSEWRSREQTRVYKTAEISAAVSAEAAWIIHTLSIRFRGGFRLLLKIEWRHSEWAILHADVMLTYTWTRHAALVLTPPDRKRPSAAAWRGDIRSGARRPSTASFLFSLRAWQSSFQVFPLVLNPQLHIIFSQHSLFCCNINAISSTPSLSLSSLLGSLSFSLTPDHSHLCSPPHFRSFHATCCFAHNYCTTFLS